MDTIYAQDLRLPRKFLSNLGGSGDKLVDGKPFLTVLLHPVTTEYEDAEKEIQELMTALESVNEQILWLWPNVDAGSETISKKIRQFKENNKNPAKIRFLRNLPVEDYNRVMNNTLCLIGNSSSGIREGAFGHFVNIGTRQNGERGLNVKDVPANSTDIKAAVIEQSKVEKYPSDKRFGSGKLEKELLRFLLKPTQVFKNN